MIEELDLFGVYAPSALVWAVLAGAGAYGLRRAFRRLPVAELLWSPGLLDLVLFAVLWWGLSAAADRFLPPWLVY